MPWPSRFNSLVPHPYRPRRRLVDLITSSVDDETVVHDSATHRITHLDATTASVWSASDGQRDVDEIAAVAGVTPSEAAAGLLRLDASGLLTDAGMSRRTLLARAGALAWTVPLVSIAAPTAAYAASPPSVPSVGTISHTCRGAHTRVFTVPVTGLPPGTMVEISVRFSPGGVITQTRTTDSQGAATFVHEFRSVGNPVRCRTVSEVSYRVVGDAMSQPIEITPYTGCCP